MWQTLKQKVRHVLEITDGVIDQIQEEEDLLRERTAREQTEYRQDKQYET